jgi:hypothetical protein
VVLLRGARPHPARLTLAFAVPYRRALPREDALAELERCAGSQFDPAVVEAFRAVVEQRRVRHLRVVPSAGLSSAAAPRTSA